MANGWHIFTLHSTCKHPENYKCCRPCQFGRIGISWACVWIKTNLFVVSAGRPPFPGNGSLQNIRLFSFSRFIAYSCTNFRRWLGKIPKLCSRTNAQVLRLTKTLAQWPLLRTTEPYLTPRTVVQVRLAVLHFVKSYRVWLLPVNLLPPYIVPATMMIS